MEGFALELCLSVC